jgi:pyruvate/2-oxoacid:ferredoxin oxidoreductase beta subunit
MYSIAHQKPKSFFPLFALKDGDPSVTHYCPGCGHGALHKFIAEAIDDLLWDLEQGFARVGASAATGVVSL